jgi:hypothetical protein
VHLPALLTRPRAFVIQPVDEQAADEAVNEAIA